MCSGIEVGSTMLWRGLGEGWVWLKANLRVMKLSNLGIYTGIKVIYHNCNVLGLSDVGSNILFISCF